MGGWAKDGWEHGRIWVRDDGVRVFHIRVKRGGRTYAISTQATTATGAVKEWNHFDADPERYQPGGDGGVKLVLNELLIDRYVESREEKGVSHAEQLAARRMLGRWREQLGGRDLRTATLADIQGALRADGRDKRGRVKTLKAMYSWLRQEGEVKPSEDPTLDTLATPATQVAEDHRPRLVNEAHYRAALPLVEESEAHPWRSLVQFVAATGCHVSEAVRLTEGTGSVTQETSTTGEAAHVVTIRHKGKMDHQLNVSAATAGAAGRLLAVKHGLDRNTATRKVNAACVAAGVPRWAVGDLRHTFIIRARERGVTDEVIAKAVGHTTAKMVERVYGKRALPPRVVGLE